MNIQRISLDVSKTIDVSPVIHIGQGDSAGTTIVARIYDNGVAASIGSMTARFCMRLPDGRHYVRDSDCVVSGNTITYVVDESHCAAVKGRTDEAYFDILAGGDVVYSTSRFIVCVLRGVTDGAVPGETYDGEIERAIQRANEAAEAAEEAAGGVTPLMSTTKLGGAKLGDGLALTGEKLGVSQITTAQIDTIANDGSVTSYNVLTGTRLTYLWSKLKQKFASLVGGAVPVSQGGTGATTAAAAVVNVVDGQALKPASVAATGEVSGKSGTTTHKLTNKAESSAVAYVEGTTATKNHAVGDYFILGGVLMKTTAAIATGESITTSNATPATVQAQIDTLRDSVAKNHGAGNSKTLTLTQNHTYLLITYHAGSVESNSMWIVNVGNNVAPRRVSSIGSNISVSVSGTSSVTVASASGSPTIYTIRLT